MGTYLKQTDVDRSKNKREAKKTEKKEPRERRGGPSDYGRYYWCVKSELSKDGDIFVMADEARVTPSGGVLFVSKSDGEDAEKIRLAIAAGQWSAVYAASCLDGSAVAVEHWKGECERWPRAWAARTWGGRVKS